MNDFSFIDAEKAQFPVAVLCATLGVSRPGYYAYKRRGVSVRSTRDVGLSAEIEQIHRDSRAAYGSPRIHEELRERGECVSRKRVIRLMQAQGIRGKKHRAFRVTTLSHHALPIAPNVLGRSFTASAPNQKWVGDITYIQTKEGWLYLAVLIDLFSRRVVGWAMSDSLETELASKALRMALQARRPPRGLIHHTDRGCQYASAAYRKLLQEHGIVASMSRKANCWDNAPAESFFATLKTELVHDIEFESRDHASRVLFEYIEVFYNRKRRHSTLAYDTPVAFEFEFDKSRAAA